MTATLLALYKRPEGDDDALQTFRQRYFAEHMPLVARVPGLRGSVVEEVAQKYAGDDIVLTCRMTFDDQAALDAGMTSPEMRDAARNLREIAPGLVTLVALQEPAE